MELRTRISYDMRQGAKLRGKADMVLYDALAQVTCAWGAAFEFRFGTEVFTLTEKDVVTVIKRAGWAWALTTWRSCPKCGYDFYVANLITHMNNSQKKGGHGLKREETADILEKWEDELGITKIVENPVAQYLEHPKGKIIPVKHTSVKEITPETVTNR